MHRKALVLGNDTRSFLSVIRSLGRGGVEVHVAWHKVDSPTMRSRYIYATHTLPPYDEHSEDWKTDLIALMQREAFDLVLPCNDPALFPLQRHRRDLEGFGRLYLLNDQAFEVLFDKFKTNELARRVGVRVPRENLVTSHEEAARIKASFSLPLVLKPPASFDVRNPSSKNMVRKAYNWEDFDRFLGEMLALEPVVVQEHVLGTGVGVELLMHDGKLLMAFQHERVHEPLEGGGSSYRRSAAISPELLDAAQKILHPLDYTGVAMVEFKVNAQTREWVLIEVNGRFWGSLPLALATGADFPMALFRLLVEGETSFPRHYRINIYCRNLSSDLQWQWANLRSDRSNPLLATRSLRRVLAETLVNVALCRERSDTFTRDDPRPGWTELRQVISSLWNSIANKLAQRYLNLPVIRRLLAHRARAALVQAKTILFICKGNICRSPFAAYLAGTFFPVGISILSGGYSQESGRYAPAMAVKMAKRWSVDLSTHRSQRVTEDLVRQADVVFVFDYHNYRRVVKDYRFARDCIHFIGAFCPEDPLFIRDPWEQDMDCFESTYDQIARSLHEAALHLTIHGQAKAKITTHSGSSDVQQARRG